MELKCTLRGKTFNIVQGASFSEEFNETLDSGSIIIDHIRRINSLRPYEDIFVYDAQYVFNGYRNIGDKYIDSNGNEVVVQEEEVIFNGQIYHFDDTTGPKMPFFKHFVVGNYTEEMVDLNVKRRTIYKYKIDLVSETKGLEKVPCPNISITQPIASTNKQKRTCYYYLKSFLDLYSPKIKAKSNLQTKEWKYVQKYRLHPSVKKYFPENTVFCPEMSWSNPTLRDVLAQIMTVKDCIPYVKNGMVYALDISQRTGEFIVDSNHINFIQGSMSAENYTQGARREYSGAISQVGSARCIEYVGFRNRDNAFMTLDNMYIETRFPIYKINKILLCYYKKATFYYDNQTTGKEKYFLCKQDITHLILQNTVRNAMADADWSRYRTGVQSIADMPKFKVLTLGYDIGSNTITGWGTKWEEISGLWTKNVGTYIEAIVDILDHFRPFGINGSAKVQAFDGASGTHIEENSIYAIDKKITEKQEFPAYKTLLFQIDYNAMSDAAVVHSKDNIEEDDIRTIDNCSASLSILEKDGLFEKEKLNRLGNKTYNLNGRYDSYEQMNDTFFNRLGSTYDDDIVIYHREYQIWDDCVICNFIGSHDYVLKNYFTSVFAKLRTWNLMSYGESVKRAEVFKTDVVLSTTDCYYEDLDFQTPDYYFYNLLSGFNTTPTPEYWEGLEQANKINSGWFEFYNNGETNRYFSDINCFTSGYSLCFNIKMYDNVTNGVYINRWSCYTDIDVESTSSEDPSGEFVGSYQKQYYAVDDVEDAYIPNIGVYVGHLNDSKSIFDTIINSKSAVTTLYDNVIRKIPQMSNQQFSTITNQIGNMVKFNKDNKELLDITFQYEPFTCDNNVIFSNWLFKLSDMFGNYNKFNSPLNVPITISKTGNMKVIYSVLTLEQGKVTGATTRYAVADFVMPKTSFDIFIKNGLSLNSNRIDENWDFVSLDAKFAYHQIIRKIKPNKIKNVSADRTEVTWIADVSLQDEHLYLSPLADTYKYVMSTRNDETAEFTGKVINYTENGQNKVCIRTILRSFKRGGFGWGDRQHSKSITERYLDPEGGYDSVLTGTTANLSLFDSTPIMNTELLETWEKEKICKYTKVNSLDTYVPEKMENPEETKTLLVALVENGESSEYPKSVYLYAGGTKLRKELVYAEYELNEIAQFDHEYISTVNNNFNSVFRLNKHNDLPCIEFDGSQFSDEWYDDPHHKTIEYWYFDKNDSKLHFVFGLNITEKIRTEKFARIYVSTVNHRSKIVYDEFHMPTSQIVNYIAEGSKIEYGVGQYYNDYDYVLVNLQYNEKEDLQQRLKDLDSYTEVDNNKTGFVGSYVVI